MSRAHDNLPVYPDNQGTKRTFEEVYDEYRLRIRQYFALKVNPMAADDLTQQVFLRAMENLDKFNGNSSLFTWIFKIAQNTVKMNIEVYHVNMRCLMTLQVMNLSPSPLILPDMLIFELILARHLSG